MLPRLFVPSTSLSARDDGSDRRTGVIIRPTCSEIELFYGWRGVSVPVL